MRIDLLLMHFCSQKKLRLHLYVFMFVFLGEICLYGRIYSFVRFYIRVAVVTRYCAFVAIIRTIIIEFFLRFVVTTYGPFFLIIYQYSQFVDSST